MGILKSIPFEEVDIKVIDIEYKHIGKIFPVSYQELKALMERNGYEFDSKIDDPNGNEMDVVFVKKRIHARIRRYATTFQKDGIIVNIYHLEWH